MIEEGAGGKLALCAWALRTEKRLKLPLRLPLLFCSSERRWDRAAICRVRGGSNTLKNIPFT